MDLDNNNYPDLLVGAYESNNAVYLKSAPVVHLDSEVQFLVSGKQINIGKIISNFQSKTESCWPNPWEIFKSTPFNRVE